MILSKSRDTYTCNECKEKIPKNSFYLNKPVYRGGSIKYCVPCIKKEIENAGL
jgi:hypothetical protein